MKTAYSLIYFECQTGTASMLDAIIGPVLFQSETAAISQLFTYVKSRVVGDDFDEMVEDFAKDVGLSLVDVFEGIEATIEFKKAFVDHYFKVQNEEEDMTVEYAIKELATSSFSEELNSADAIEIDGNFVRHFNVLSSDEECEEANEMYLEARTGDFEYAFSLDDVMNATYCIERKVWVVKGCNVTLIKFA